MTTFGGKKTRRWTTNRHDAYDAWKFLFLLRLWILLKADIPGSRVWETILDAAQINLLIQWNTIYKVWRPRFQNIHRQIATTHMTHKNFYYCWNTAQRGHSRMTSLRNNPRRGAQHFIGVNLKTLWGFCQVETKIPEHSSKNRPKSSQRMKISILGVIIILLNTSQSGHSRIQSLRNNPRCGTY